TGFVGSENIYESPVGNYVMELLRRTLPSVKIPGAVALIAPLVVEYLDKEFDEKVRAEVQHKLMSILISWGLIKAKPKKSSTPSIWTSIILMLLLTGCSALFTPINNQLTAGGSSLTYTDYGAVFDPGNMAAVNIIVTLQGDVDSAPEFIVESGTITEFTQRVERIEADQFLPLSFTCGEEDCYVWVSFRRESGSIHEVLPN
ncbi:MAG: hypothetical protein ACRDBG_27690, partial [Waterburya sp.]